MALRTDYKDDILSSGNLRKYQMINNGDGTVSFQDVTVYQQTGDTFGAGDINNTNQAVNEKLDSDDVVDPMETTVPGFAADALAVKNQFNEQNKNLGMDLLWTNDNVSSAFSSQTLNLDLSKYRLVMIITKFINSSSLERRNYKYFTDYMPVGITANIGGTCDLMAYRKITVNTNRIVFESGKTVSSWNSNNSDSANNEYAIPFKIYGIK